MEYDAMAPFCIELMKRRIKRIEEERRMEIGVVSKLHGKDWYARGMSTTVSMTISLTEKELFKLLAGDKIESPKRLGAGAYVDILIMKEEVKKDEPVKTATEAVAEDPGNPCLEASK